MYDRSIYCKIKVPQQYLSKLLCILITFRICLLVFVCIFVNIFTCMLYFVFKFDKVKFFNSQCDGNLLENKLRWPHSWSKWNSYKNWFENEKISKNNTSRDNIYGLSNKVQMSVLIQDVILCENTETI